MKLVIGAGDRQKEGWIHHDVKAMPGIQLVCDLREIEQHVEAESCEEIEMTHVIEHFSREEVPSILQILKRLLKPGGKLYLETPNLRYHAELLLKGDDEKAEYYAFGGQLDKWDFHKTGFTFNILFKRLKEAGFTEIDIVPNSTLEATCLK